MISYLSFNFNSLPVLLVISTYIFTASFCSHNTYIFSAQNSRLKCFLSIITNFTTSVVSTKLNFTLSLKFMHFQSSMVFCDQNWWTVIQWIGQSCHWVTAVNITFTFSVAWLITYVHTFVCVYVCSCDYNWSPKLFANGRMSTL